MSNPAPKITMAEIWDQLDEIEKAGIATMLGINVGQLALMKVSNVFKGVFYRFHDRERLQQEANQSIIQQMRHQYELEKMKHEEQQRQRRIYEDMRQASISSRDWNKSFRDW